MYRERLTFWITSIAIVLAAWGYAFDRQKEAVYSLSIPAVLHLGYIAHVKRNSKRGVKSAGNRSSSLQHIRSAELQGLLDQRDAMGRIMKAIDAIGNDSQHDAISEINDEAGEAIANLRSKLGTLQETERQRSWEAQGMSAINDIRKNKLDLAGYSDRVISFLVKYLNANQGAFFHVNHDEQLVLLATYAYGERRQSEEVIIEKGNGLIGQCFEEKQVILMNNVPPGYTKIRSGLGEGTPQSIAIIPLIFREMVFGVLEVAAFEKLKAYQLDFLNKACETVALELYNIRTQENTRKMMEQSREDELRQNLEEMKATQQQMLIKEEELNQQLVNTKRAVAMAEAERKKNEAILEGCMDAVISFSQAGVVAYFNKAAEEVFGVNRSEVIGQPVNKLLGIQIDANDEGAIRIISTAGAEVTLRTEVSAIDHAGEEIALLLTATKVKIDNVHLFTLFAQKVSVELF